MKTKEKTVETKKKSKGKKALKVLCVILAVIIGAAGVCAVMSSVGNKANEITMTDLMQLAQQYQNQHEFEKAKVCLERAAFASYLPAKFRLACFLRDTTNLEQTQAERFSRCEQLLQEVERAIDQKDILARVYFELSVLYEKMNRPISCLGYLLKSRRHGCDIDEKIISDYRKKIHRQVDINKLSEER